MTRDRPQMLAGVILAATLATVALPVLVMAHMLAALSHPPDDLLLWVGTRAFHGAFHAGQWFGFAVIALVLSFSGFLSAQPRAHIWTRAALALLMAMAISAGWQGYRYQQRSVALAKANQALCPSPDKTNRAAMNFRGALDARAAAERASTGDLARLPINDTIAAFIPAGASLSKAEALAKDAGLSLRAATSYDRQMHGDDLAFVAICSYAVGDLNSQALTIAVYQDMNAAGTAKVGRTEALIVNNSSL